MCLEISAGKVQADLKVVLTQNDSNAVQRALSLSTNGRQDNLEAVRKIHQAIEEAAATHLNLLKELQRTQDATYVVENNQRTISYLEDELEAQKKLAEEAAQSTAYQLQRCRKASTSTLKNWNHKSIVSAECIGPALEPKQAYYQALAIQSKAELRAMELKVDAENLERETSAALYSAERHGAAQKQIEDLYARIFDGETPGFPEEDELEERFNRHSGEHSATVATREATIKASKSLAKLLFIFDRIDKNINEARKELDRSHRFSGVSYVALLVARDGDLIGMAQERLKEAFDTLPQPHTPEFTQQHDKLTNHLETASSWSQLTRNGVAYAWVSKQAASDAVGVIRAEIEAARETHTMLTKTLRVYERTATTAYQATGRSLNQSKESLLQIRQDIFSELGHDASAPPYRHYHSEEDPIIDASGLPPPPIYTTSPS